MKTVIISNEKIDKAKEQKGGLASIILGTTAANNSILAAKGA